MRRLILFLCCNLTCATVLCIVSPADSKPRISPEMRTMHGPVRSIHSETRMVTPDGQQASQPYLQEDRSFNRDGWSTEDVKNVRGEKSEEWIWRREGSIILSQETTFFTGPRAHKEVQTNDAQGRPMELLISTLDGTLKERTVRQYEPGGIRELTYDGSGKLLDDTFRTEKEERTDGGVVTQTSANGKPERVVSKQGPRTEVIYYSSDGTVKGRRVIEADKNEEHGVMTEKDGFEDAYTKDSAGTRQDIQIDPKGSRLVSTFSPNGVKREYYDQNGKLLKTTTTSYDRYDEHGNWVHSTEYITQPNSQPRVQSVTTRDISYYE
jgi:hypothetical protein